MNHAVFQQTQIHVSLSNIPRFNMNRVSRVTMCILESIDVICVRANKVVCRWRFSPQTASMEATKHGLDLQHRGDAKVWAYILLSL